MGKVVYFKGEFVDESKATISVFSHALHYGTGCFEGIRAYYNKEKDKLYAFRMADHYKRLLQSAKILFMHIPYGESQLCKITLELLQKNFSQTDIYIRPLAFKSDPAVGNFNLQTLKDDLLIYTTPLGRYLNTEKGIRCNISSWTRVFDNSIPPRAKITGSYVNTALAKTESLLAGYDEALFLDRDGHIIEGSAENIFIVQNGIIITPIVSDGILQGITRETIIQLAKDDLHLTVLERSIDRSEIYQADEVFLVGTGAEVTPVIEIEGRKIGDGAIGKITKEMKDIYYKMVHGEYAKYEKYITEVLPSKI